MIASPNTGSVVSLFASQIATLGWFQLSRIQSEYCRIISGTSQARFGHCGHAGSPVQTKNSCWTSRPASSAISSHLSGTGPMQKRNVFHPSRFGRSTSRRRTHASSHGSSPDSGSSKKRCRVMFEPRRK